jgi:hypothetical protein
MEGFLGFFTSALGIRTDNLGRTAMVYFRINLTLHVVAAALGRLTAGSC